MGGYYDYCEVCDEDCHIDELKRFSVKRSKKLLEDKIVICENCQNDFKIDDDSIILKKGETIQQNIRNYTLTTKTI